MEDHHREILKKLASITKTRWVGKPTFIRFGTCSTPILRAAHNVDGLVAEKLVRLERGFPLLLFRCWPKFILPLFSGSTRIR
jgi:hypothetical protein